MGPANTDAGSLVDETPRLNSGNLVSSRGLFDAFATKMPLMIIDTTPTENSDNLVNSGGTYDFITNAIDGLMMSNIVDLPMQIAAAAPGDTTTTLQITCETINLPRIVLTDAPFTDAKSYFRRFKTTTAEILGDSEDAPISDSALLEARRFAVIGETSGGNQHLLPPNGEVIFTHLNNNYEPINNTLVVATAVRLSTGYYQITFNPAASNSIYTIHLTLEASQGTQSSEPDDDLVVTYTQKYNTGFRVIITEQDNGSDAGTYRDNKFDFVCFKSGKLLCHASVKHDGYVYV